jgi:hypothetical protein
MTAQGVSTSTLQQLQLARNGMILHQAMCAAAKLGVADLMEKGEGTTGQLAGALKVNEDMLYRLLRALAGEGVFEEYSPRTFRNSQLSRSLCEGSPGSLRPFYLFWGTEFYYRSLGEIVHSVKTGDPAIGKVLGMNEWEYMRQNPEMAAIFENAMTSNANLTGPAVAEAYDFGQWESIMDVGGGHGILLSNVLRRHTSLHGILADQPDVLERARLRGFLDGELAPRTSMQDCDFFSDVPSGCRAYMMKSVIHDWDDEKAQQILMNCRRAVPDNGVLLILECELSEPNLPSAGKLIDLVMMVLAGGKERTLGEYGELLGRAGFRLNKVIPTASEVTIIEALPV